MNDDNILLQVKNLHASIEGKEILKGIDLTVRPGEVHAIMGPNGSASRHSAKCSPATRHSR